MQPKEHCIWALLEHHIWFRLCREHILNRIPDLEFLEYSTKADTVSNKSNVTITSSLPITPDSGTQVFGHLVEVLDFKLGKPWVAQDHAPSHDWCNLSIQI
jgi:hypothetical protein